MDNLELDKAINLLMEAGYEGMDGSVYDALVNRDERWDSFVLEANDDNAYEDLLAGDTILSYENNEMVMWFKIQDDDFDLVYAEVNNDVLSYSKALEYILELENEVHIAPVTDKGETSKEVEDSETGEAKAENDGELTNETPTTNEENPEEIAEEDFFEDEIAEEENSEEDFFEEEIAEEENPDEDFFEDENVEAETNEDFFDEEENQDDSGLENLQDMDKIHAMDEEMPTMANQLVDLNEEPLWETMKLENITDEDLAEYDMAENNSTPEEEQPMEVVHAMDEEMPTIANQLVDLNEEPLWETMKLPNITDGDIENFDSGEMTPISDEVMDEDESVTEENLTAEEDFFTPMNANEESDDSMEGEPEEQQVETYSENDDDETLPIDESQNESDTTRSDDSFIPQEIVIEVDESPEEWEMEEIVEEEVFVYIDNLIVDYEDEE